MGKGKSTSTHMDPSTHSAAPLSTLKDPSAFGPPPKHVAAHGQEAADQSSKNGGDTGSARGPPQVPRSRPQVPTSSDVNHDQDSSMSIASSIPSRHDLESKSPKFSPASSAASGTPKLPPRLPPRQNTVEEEELSPPPPYHEVTEEASEETGYINQAAAGRLGRAGISAPGLGVGGGTQSRSPGGKSGTSSGQLNELQSRFAKTRSSNTTETNTDPPSQGTTWAQKKAAMRTAESFKKDPSSVSLSDARSAASTANSFRQRHGDQVKSGLDKANSLNQRFGDGRADNETEEDASQDEVEKKADPIATAAATKKKPPPPPKKATLSSSSSSSSTPVAAHEPASTVGSPPPVPLASKPRPA